MILNGCRRVARPTAPARRCLADTSAEHREVSGLAKAGDHLVAVSRATGSPPAEAPPSRLAEGAGPRVREPRRERWRRAWQARRAASQERPAGYAAAASACTPTTRTAGVFPRAPTAIPAIS